MDVKEYPAVPRVFWGFGLLLRAVIPHFTFSFLRPTLLLCVASLSAFDVCRHSMRERATFVTMKLRVNCKCNTKGHL